jgi:hypothetical protein
MSIEQHAPELELIVQGEGDVCLPLRLTVPRFTMRMWAVGLLLSYRQVACKGFSQATSRSSKRCLRRIASSRTIVASAASPTVPWWSRPGRLCRKVRFLGKIQKLGVGNSMAYRLLNSRNSNFATEPEAERDSTMAQVEH